MRRNLFNDLSKILAENALEVKINEYKGGKSLYAKFKVGHYAPILSIIWKILMKHMDMGEVINIHSFKGEFRDMGIKTIEIEDGELWEFYDYEFYEHYYIRLLKMRDINRGDKWLALYIDYNPNSPWWTEEERR